MNKLLLEYTNSNSSQSNTTENIISLSQSSQEKIIDNQIQKNQIQNETPLSTKGNVKSYCRIRPNDSLYSTLKYEILNNNKILRVDFKADQDKNNPSKQSLFKYYNFTEIFGEKTTNLQIYEKVCDQSIEELFSKHKNALIFVYGITNSGKTYTVNGDLQNPGILQFSLLYLFKRYQIFKKDYDLQLTCTFIEIYNEEVFDLLSKERKKIKIREMGNKFFPQGCIVKNIETEQDFTNALTIGELNKTKAETNVNPYSSRSHSIFRVEISYRNNQFIGPVSFCMVDLAGAERVGKSGVLGNSVKETGNINSSLLVLKKCFDAMEANSRPNFAEKKVIVPVRESKLTMLFKEYFADHQNISVICTINPIKKEILDIKNVLSFGAKVMKVKPIKSWIPTYNSSSREVSPNKIELRDNTPLKDKKIYRLFTDKKYIKHYNNNNSQKSISKEKNNKCNEDYYSNHLSNNKKKNNNINSSGKTQNIKLVYTKKNDQNNDENSNNNNNRFNINNNKQRNDFFEDNLNNNKILNYEQRIKCTTNPFEDLSTNNFFVKISPSKEKIKLERLKKEQKQIEIREKMSKKGEEIKHVVIDLLIKKIYYNNKERNIEAYENQCNNIDLKEAEILLSKNNNLFSLRNPFIKSFEEDKKIFSKTHQINFSYANISKEKIYKNENNINISYKGQEKNNNNNYAIFNNYNIGYAPEKNNDLDITRTNCNLLDELQIKLNNSNDHDQTKIHEYLDSSFEKYQTSKFKAYFGIGESLIKKLSENRNMKKNELDNKNLVSKFNSINNDIEMADKVPKNDDNLIFNDSFKNVNNFKRKGKNNKTNNNNIDYDDEEKKINDEKVDDDIYNSNKDIINTEEDLPLENKSDNEYKKKKKKSKKKKKVETAINTDEEQNENEEKEKYPKSKKNNKKKGSKKNIKLSESNEDTSEDDTFLLANKKNKKRKKKNKKKKMESDNDNSDDNSFSDENINIKPPKSKKKRSKKK